MQSGQELLNHIFDTNNSCRSFLKVMHLTLDYWRPHQDPEGWKQDPGGLDSNLAYENLGDDTEEALSKINGMFRKEAAE